MDRLSIESVSFSQLSECNHVFKVEGPIHWSRVLLPFYRKKFRHVYPVWCSRFYIITLYSSKSYVKSWGSVQILGSPLDPPVVASMLTVPTLLILLI